MHKVTVALVIKMQDVCVHVQHYLQLVDWSFFTANAAGIFIISNRNTSTVLLKSKRVISVV